MMGPVSLVDISGVEELRFIREEGGRIRIGACVKLAELFESDLLRCVAETLLNVANEIGPKEVRNMGTVGGNLCCARANCGVCFLPGCKGMTGDRKVPPCRNAAYADLLLPLAAYGASLTLKRVDGERTVAIRSFLNQEGRLDLKPGEILAEISFPTPKADGWGYARLRYPDTMGLPYICVIAERHGDSFDLTLGGSIKGIHRVEAWRLADGTDTITERLMFGESLAFSPEYRTRSLPSLVREAVRACEGGTA